MLSGVAFPTLNNEAPDLDPSYAAVLQIPIPTFVRCGASFFCSPFFLNKKTCSFFFVLFVTFRTLEPIGGLPSANGACRGVGSSDPPFRLPEFLPGWSPPVYENEQKSKKTAQKSIPGIEPTWAEPTVINHQKNPVPRRPPLQDDSVN